MGEEEEEEEERIVGRRKRSVEKETGVADVGEGGRKL